MSLGMELVRDTNDRDRRRARTVRCVECGISSGAFWVGWRAYRTDDPELGESPQLGFYCPACSIREFGGWSRRV